MGKVLILETDKEAKSRGITFKRLNNPNWIDMVPRALNDEITFESITHEGTFRERWLAYDGIEDRHRHDKEGAKMRAVTQANDIMVERGVTHIIINSTGYRDEEEYHFDVI